MFYNHHYTYKMGAKNNSSKKKETKRVQRRVRRPYTLPPVDPGGRSSPGHASSDTYQVAAPSMSLDYHCQGLGTEIWSAAISSHLVIVFMVDL